MPDRSLTLPPAEVTNAQLYALIEQLHGRVALQNKSIDDATGEVAKMRAEMDEILGPWRASKAMGTALKWLATLIVSLGVIWAAVEGVRAWVRG